MFKKSILLSSQPNPSSYSQLVKSRYRMAETKVPADPVQLPARYLERNKAEKARSIRHDWNEKGQKRKRKARMIATQADNVGPDTQLGAREMPIIIKDDRIPITRPENAPISFVDDLPGHAERLVTPDISRWHAISRIVIPSPSQEESITGRSSGRREADQTTSNTPSENNVPLTRHRFVETSPSSSSYFIRGSSIRKSIEIDGPFTEFRDIPHYPTRAKTAQLIVIEPEIPSVISISSTDLEENVKPGLAPELLPSHPIYEDTSMLIDDDDEEAVMVKVEFDDHEIWNDEPILNEPSPSPPPKRRKKGGDLETKSSSKPYITTKGKSKTKTVLNTGQASSTISSINQISSLYISDSRILSPICTPSISPPRLRATKAIGFRHLNIPASSYRPTSSPSCSSSSSCSPCDVSRDLSPVGDGSIKTPTLISDSDHELSHDGAYEYSASDTDTDTETQEDELEISVQVNVV